jgi:hypothetical protein
MRGRLRYLHFRVHPPTKLDRWCFVAVTTASVFAAMATAALALLGDLPLLCLWGPAALLTVPWMVTWLATRPALQSLWQAMELPMSTTSVSRIAVFAIAMILLVMVGKMESGNSSLAMTVVLLFLAQSFGLHTHRADGSAVMTLLASCTTCLVVSNALDSIFGLVLFLIGTWISGTGLLWVHARATRRRLNLRLRLTPSRDPSADGLWSRAVLMAMMVPLMVVVTSVSTRGVATAGSWGWSAAGSAMHSLGWIDRPPQASPSSRADQASSGTTRGDQNSDKPPADPRTFPSAPRGFPSELLAAKRGLGAPSRLDRLLVSDPFAPGGRRRFFKSNPLYLTCATYDRFTPTGVEHSRQDPAFEFDDFGDGREDDWTYVGKLESGASRLELDIEFQPLLAPGGRNSGRLLLPRLEPLIAVSLPKVRYSPSGLLTHIPATPGPVRYAIRSQLPSIQGKDIGNQHLDLSFADQTELPAESQGWGRVMELVRDEIKKMDLSAGPVRGVQLHFRKHYRYELAVDGMGPKSLETFFRDREGYCTYFAIAATLCLRELGVPARVAAGYTVTRWDAKNRVYRAGAGGAHAWSEVPVLGVGWVPVEVTPAAAFEMTEDLGQVALSQLYPGEKEQPNVPLPGLGTDENALLPSGAEAGEETGEAAGSENPLMEAVAEFNLFHAWQFWTVLVAMALGILVLLAKAVGFHGFGKVDDGDPLHPDRHAPRADAFRQLIRLLSKLGFPKHRSQTTLEYARRVVQHGGEDYDPLLDLTWTRYQEHFGDYPPDPEFGAEIEEFTRQVKAMDRRKD